MPPGHPFAGSGTCRSRGAGRCRRIDAVSMRRLAARLDVVPMALYKHVTNKRATCSTGWSRS